MGKYVLMIIKVIINIVNTKGNETIKNFIKMTIKEIAKMKKLAILIILMLTVMSCSYMEGGERLIRERGMRCRYNYKGELQHCGFIN
ncbi:hypothetical protein HMPREF1552_02419 [Leptotrichia sp. oral taxon 879 str. F0557]|nr:hypothetical protein HMPREF1552_02419 [Leptotrichia sp. oral taxon 879 str. F0557]